MKKRRRQHRDIRVELPGVDCGIDDLLDSSFTVRDRNGRRLGRYELDELIRKFG